MKAPVRPVITMALEFGGCILQLRPAADPCNFTATRPEHLAAAAARDIYSAQTKDRPRSFWRGNCRMQGDAGVAGKNSTSGL
jgi:hypothetical protein